jgi:hypothetical protein
MLLDDFAVNLVAISRWTQKKRSLGAWSCFLPSLHIWQGLKDFLPLPKPKREFVEEIITPLEFKKKKEAVTTSGEYL